MPYVDPPPDAGPEWTEIFNRAWMAVPQDVREQIAASDDGSRDAGHYLERAITLLRVQRDTAQGLIKATYSQWTGRDFQHLPLPDAVGAVVSELRGRLDSRQAHIDALMWEYCPEDMTEEQRHEWARHQKPVKGS